MRMLLAPNRHANASLAVCDPLVHDQVMTKPYESAKIVASMRMLDVILPEAPSKVANSSQHERI